MIKLTDLDPYSVADDVRVAINSHVQRLAFSANIGGPPLDEWPCQAICLNVRNLAAYAIRGTPLDAPAIDYAQSIAELLYVRPADGLTYDTGELFADADPSTSWGLVIRAALVRDSLAAGEAVDLRDLSILSGITLDGVRRNVISGELSALKKRDDDRPGAPAIRVSADEAKRWLSGRGVPGF